MKKVMLLLLVVVICSTAGGADWLRFRGPDGSGISPDRGVVSKWSGTENILWKTELPGAGTSSPIFVGDRILLTCYSGYNVPRQDPGNMSDLKRHVVCLNRQTGKVQWTTPIPSKLPEQ